MKLHSLPIALALSAISTVSALRLPFSQYKRSTTARRSGTSFSVRPPSSPSSKAMLLAANATSDANDLDLTTAHDMIYMANITVGGSSYIVQLDTGSSDLWIKGLSNPLPNTSPTSQTYNLTYGIGWAYGHISYAPVTFAGISIKSQAFLDVSSAVNPALVYGGDGILGLGFTSLSTIDSLVNSSGAATGRSLLYNLFQDNPSEPNFIGFLLQRSTDPNDEVEGSFSIGEYEPDYATVANSSAIATWPENSPNRWSVLLDAVLVGNQTITPATTVPGAPSNKAVIALDSGTSYTYAPTAICDAIYKNVPGATLSASGQWIVPCGSEIDIALQIGGQVFPMHPLDVTPANTADNSQCVGSFIPQSVSVGAGEFDWLVGDNFLRSVYSIYDFGDLDSLGKMGNPHVKLLSIIDPDEASVDFHKIRGGSPNTNITYNASTANAAASDSTTVNLSSQLASTLDKIGTYIPAMLAIMALNAVVFIVAVVFGIFFLLKRRRTKVPARTPRGRMSPMPMNTRSSYAPPLSSYQPVSMAMSEDPFFPPSPAFHSDQGDTLRSQDRPKSVA